jgi:hypothetical protein
MDGYLGVRKEDVASVASVSSWCGAHRVIECDDCSAWRIGGDTEEVTTGALRYNYSATLLKRQNITPHLRRSTWLSEGIMNRSR